MEFMQLLPINFFFARKISKSVYIKIKFFEYFRQINYSKNNVRKRVEKTMITNLTY